MNPNSGTGIAAGDKIHTTVTIEADKDIGIMFVKNEFNHGSCSGIDTQKVLPANTATVFDIYGAVAGDYDDSARIVLALRGNDADTVLKISDIKVEKIENYAVRSLSIKADVNRIAFEETATLSATDQYGIKLNDATFEIKNTEEVSAVLSGNKLKAGNVAEEIKVVAKYGDLVSDELIITVYTETYSNITLFDTAETINEMRVNNPEFWYGSWTVDVENDELVATGVENNACFGIYLNSPAAYKTGAKLSVTYTASKNFAVKPVAPDLEFIMEASTEEKTVEVDLGNANKITKIGIVFKAENADVKITSIKIINEQIK